jgi:hypothetical protein
LSHSSHCLGHFFFFKKFKASVQRFHYDHKANCENSVFYISISRKRSIKLVTNHNNSTFFFFFLNGSDSTLNCWIFVGLKFKMINEDLKNKIKQVGGARGARQNVQARVGNRICQKLETLSCISRFIILK